MDVWKSTRIGALNMRNRVLKRILPSRLRKLSKDESGITAIEFAMVAGPFLFLLFGIISVGFYFFVAFSLERAVDEASRVIRTGQAQTQQPNPMTSAEFKTLVCSKLPPFMKARCSGGGDKIRVHVQNFANFNGAPASCTNVGGQLIPANGQQYSPGGASSVVLVTICFEWEFTQTLANMTYWITPTNARMANGSTLLRSSTVFTSEPYN